MAKKNNIRSIRISDKMAELIDRQAGANFTEKWENLVTRCIWELPQKEQELKQLEKRISEKQHQLAAADSRYAKMLNHLRALEPKMEALEYAVAKAITDWKVEERNTTL